jgi:DNA-binding NarL/FixJ family response regulator
MYRQGVRTLLTQSAQLIVVREAVDAEEAIEQAHVREPDVILMDVHAPGIDVVETISRIRSELPHLRFVTLGLRTDEPGLVLQAIRAGVQGYVLHDASLPALIGAISLVAQGQVVLAPQFLAELLRSLDVLERSDTHDARIDQLSAREREVLELVSQGISDRKIAQQLFVSESTVRSHVKNILDKLNVANRIQAVAVVYNQSLELLQPS